MRRPDFTQVKNAVRRVWAKADELARANLPQLVEKVVAASEELAKKPWVIKAGEWLEAFLQKFDTNRKPSHDYLPDADRIEIEPIAQGAPITLYTILALLVLSFLWAAISDLDQVVPARGKLLSTEPNIILQSSDTAEIKAINAVVGQRVKAGELLFTLDPTVVEADLRQISEKFASLDAQMRRLQAEQLERPFVPSSASEDRTQYQVWQQRSSTHQSKLLQYRENTSRLEDSVALSRSEVATLESRVRSLKEIEQMNTDLVEKKFQSRRALLDSTDRRLEAEQILASAKNRLNEHMRNLRVLESERKAYVSEYRRSVLEELEKVRLEHDSLNQQMRKAERKAEQINLVAPRDAIILEVVKLSVGSIARLAEPLVTLVPTDTPMLAEVNISPSDVSGVKLEQETRVKIDSYPFQRFGYLTGKVSAISPDAVTNGGESAERRPVYVARIEIANWNFKGSETPGPILPGMTLTAEIITGKRSVLSYITEPIVKVKDEALRER